MQRYGYTLCAAALTAAVAQAQYGDQEVVQTISGPIDVASDDTNGDGDLDLIVASSSSRIYHVENLGEATLGTAQIVENTITALQSISLADVDGDGRRDILCASLGASGVSWVPSLGNGAFGPPQPVSSGTFACYDVAGIDVDEDGDMDVVAASSTNPADTVAWFENTGGATFAPPVVITNLADGARTIDFGDLDGDGLLDLVVGSSIDDKVAWYRNLNGGGFGPQSIVTTGADGVRDVLAVDYDDDGDADIVVAEYDGDRFTVHANQGGGTFAAPVVIDAAANGADDVVAADLDQDGDLDIIGCSALAHRVSFYENVGFGFFNIPVDLTGPSPNAAFGATAALVFDADGDADLDVVSVSTGDAKLALYRDLGTVGTTYCTSNPNSTGNVGALALTGTRTASLNALVMTATDLPQASFGFFITSRTADMVANPAGSEGVLCLGGSIGRYVGPGQIQFTGVLQRMRLAVDLGAMPSPTGPIGATPGETWRFQAWHRDSVNGVSTSNFTDAVAVPLQ